MPRIHSVAVFCGSRDGGDPASIAAARSLGAALAARSWRLVYGGGRVGLMGAVADATLAGGGTVVGVIPEFLMQREVAHPGLGELIVTADMHSRKHRMFELADAFVALPGGLGTLDEIIEIITWRQLGLHAKPVFLCDVGGSAQPLLAMVDATIKAGFTLPSARDLFTVADGVAELLVHLARAEAHPEAQPARF